MRPTSGCPHLARGGTPLPRAAFTAWFLLCQVPALPSRRLPTALFSNWLHPKKLERVEALPFLFFSLVTTVMAMVLGGTSSPTPGMRLTWSERKLLLSVFLMPVSLFSPSFFLSSPWVVQ